jgi:hypothetical protein
MFVLMNEWSQCVQMNVDVMMDIIWVCYVNFNNASGKNL